MRARWIACLLGAAAAMWLGAGVALASAPGGMPGGIPGEEPTGVPIGKLSRRDVGRLVSVSGVVSDTGSFSAGFKFVISDATGALNMTLFTSVYDRLTAPERLNIGSRVTVTGKLSEYKGALEIVPSRDRDVQVSGSVAAAWPPTRPTGKIAPQAGARVSISGTILAVEKFKLGLKLRVDDGSGPRWVTLFDTVLSRIARADELAAGRRVQVAGKVSVFRRSAEITPALPCDVVVLEAQPVPASPDEGGTGRRVFSMVRV